SSLTNPYNETTDFTHDALGRVTRQDNANGTYSTWTFDASGQVDKVETRKSNGDIVLSMDHTRDNVGNPTQMAEQLLDIDNATLHTSTLDFGYDDINRLTMEKRTGYQPIWYEYAMDPAGNRTQFVQKDPATGQVLGTTNGAYDAANKLQTYGNTSYTWALQQNLWVNCGSGSAPRV
ncbi:MAG: hypothetical protein ACE5FA_12410, partial [Dehalococcoidia bacterium]